MTQQTTEGLRGPGIFLAQFISDEAPFDTLANIAQWAASQGYTAIQLPTLGTRYIDLERAAESQSYCDELKAVCASAGTCGYSARIRRPSNFAVAEKAMCLISRFSPMPMASVATR